MNVIRLALALAAFISFVFTVICLTVFGAYGLVMLAGYLATGKLWSMA